MKTRQTDGLVLGQFGRPDSAALSFDFRNVLKQDVFDVVRHGTMLTCRKDSDFIEDIILQTKRKYALVGCHIIASPDLYTLMV